MLSMEQRAICLVGGEAFWASVLPLNSLLYPYLSHSREARSPTKGVDTIRGLILR
jgi:hypothetical protein